MKKRIITGAAAALTTAVSLGACGVYGPPHNTNPAVYGPPEYFESKTASATETTSETSPAPTSDSPVPELYGPPEWSETDVTSDSEPTVFSAEENNAECVYGPPEWFETDETTTAETTVETDETTEETDETDEDDDTTLSGFFDRVFDAEDNIPEDVYGPPEWFE